MFFPNETRNNHFLRLLCFSNNLARVIPWLWVGGRTKHVKTWKISHPSQEGGWLGLQTSFSAVRHWYLSWTPVIKILMQLFPHMCSNLNFDKMEVQGRWCDDKNWAQRIRNDVLFAQTPNGWGHPWSNCALNFQSELQHSGSCLSKAVNLGGLAKTKYHFLQSLPSLRFS